MQNCGTFSNVGTRATAQEVAKSKLHDTLPNHDNAMCASLSYISELHFRATEYISDGGWLVLVLVIDGCVNVAHQYLEKPP